MTVVVRRSALKMWLMAVGGIPLLVISLDVLTNRRITNLVRELVFRPQDTQDFEPRDVIWAWVMAAFALFIILWGLKELLLPTKVVECREEGLALKIAGPIRQAAIIPWDQVIDVTDGEVEDEGDKLPHLMVKVASREGLPENPWSARWVGDLELGVMAQDWSERPEVVAQKIGDYAVERAKREARRGPSTLEEVAEQAVMEYRYRTARLWEDE